MDDKQTKTFKLSPNFKISSELLNYVPEASAQQYKIVPLSLKDNELKIGALDPTNLDVRDALNFIASRQGLTYSIEALSEVDFENLIKQYGNAGIALNEALEQLEGEEGVVLGIEDEDNRGIDVSGEGGIQAEAPVIKLVSTILSQAVSRGASDIHIEPQTAHSIIRFRIDGILEEALRFPNKVHDPLVARIKILSNLRLDERRRPQDGRFSSSIKKIRVDFRVATFPTPNGEKVALRVLDRTRGLRSLNELGLTEELQKRIAEAVKRPFGLILATGPTGAGKTTTLYALLNTLDKVRKNVVSLEDPVEYRLEGVNQSNIRPEIGYSFATGLRSILRGDPDQILVGEIRDKETAQLAVQAALTGHTVFSTIHTNTAVGAVSRLVNFGIDPFLLAPTLSLVIGQRMTRRLAGAGKEIPILPGMKRKIEEIFSDLPKDKQSLLPPLKSFREAVPTGDSSTGMQGRIGVFEVLDVSENIRDYILEGKSEVDIYNLARKEGMLNITEDAIMKGLKGDIPLSEVVRVSGETIFGFEEEPFNEETPPEANDI